MRRSPPTTIGSRAVKAGLVLQSAVHLAAVAAVEQFEVAVDRIRDAGCLGRPRIGGVGIAEAAIGALGPDRPGCRGGEAAQHLGFFEQRLVPEIGFSQFPAQSAEFANPHNGLAADGAAHRLEGASVRGGEIEQKALAGVAQARRPHDPSAAPVPAATRFRTPGCAAAGSAAASGGISSEMSPLICGRLSPAGPGNQDLRFGEQQRAKAVGLDLQALDVGAQPRLVFRRAQPGAHQQDRRHHRKAEQRQRRGQAPRFPGG